MFMPVELRCGLQALIKRVPLPDLVADWQWIGAVVRRDESLEAPHLWHYDGEWRDDGQPHPLDIVKWTAQPAAAAHAQHKAP